jgi:hypothetical protein
MASLIAWCLDFPNGTYLTGGITTGVLTIGSVSTVRLAASPMGDEVFSGKFNLYLNLLKIHPNLSSFFFIADKNGAFSYM